MLHVVLTILKIIGIILCVIIGIILFLLLAVLFVPIRYKATGSKYEKISGVIKISWFFHIISGYISYKNDEVVYKIRIFGFPVVNSLKDGTDDSTEYSSDDNKKKSGKDKDKAKVKTKEKAETISSKKTVRAQRGDDMTEVLEITEIPEQAEMPEQTYSQKAEAYKREESQYAKEEAEEADAYADSDHLENARIDKKSIFRKISDCVSNAYLALKRICFRIKSIILGLIETVKGIFDKTVSLKESVADKIKEFNENINTAENRELLKFLFGQLKKVLKHIAPRKYRITLRFGASEPDVTGKVIGYVAMANAFLNLRLKFMPVFDEQVFEGKVYIRGHIRVFPLLIIAFRVYRNKQFKKMIKKFK